MKKKKNTNFLGKIVPDSKRGRAPAFSFGSRYINSITGFNFLLIIFTKFNLIVFLHIFRHATKNDSPGPGPGQYNIFGLSAKGKITYSC